MKKDIPERLLLATGILGFIFILTITFLHQQPPLFDEAFFVKNFESYEKFGLSEKFLVGMQDQAPGPLYEFVHFTLRPFTHLTTPGIRLVNVFLLGMTILVIARILMLTRKSGFAQGLNFAVAIVAVPMVWQVTGLALTEMPTMFFSMLSVLFLLLAVRDEDQVVKSTILAIAAGLAFGLSILGRSPFMVLAFASTALLFGNFKSIARWRTVLIYCVCGLSISVPVFLVWKGLVPPQQAYIGKGFSVWHGILSFAYASMLTLFIAPRWFYFNKKTILWLAGGYIVLLMVNIYWVHFEYAPLAPTLARIFPGAIYQYYPLLISPLLATLSLYFVTCCMLRAWEHRSDTVFLFLLLAAMLLLASSFKVTHLFSTRYVAQASPFLVLLFPDYDSPTAGRWIRFILGMVIGFASLETYFNIG